MLTQTEDFKGVRLRLASPDIILQLVARRSYQAGNH